MSVARTTRSESGFTFLEMTIVVAILGVIISSAVSAFGAGVNHVHEGRTLTRAESELRSNLVMLTNYLRGADLTKLQGFDGSGVATAPRIKRVRGADHLGRIYDPEVTLEWRADARPVNGIDHPGSIYAVSAGGTELLAKRVPKDGFLVRQEGSNLVIQLRTYYVTSAGTIVELEDAAVIALRNKE